MNEQEAIILIKRTKPKGNSAIEIQLNGALDLAISALEKQIPKKPNIGNDNGRERKYCGNCGCFYLPASKYCSKCGQAIDWSE